jgi:hypothetical protein
MLHAVTRGHEENQRVTQRHGGKSRARIVRRDHGGRSNMAMLEPIRGMKGRGSTVHAFRSSFRDWAAEQTNFPREIAEAALAHVVGRVEGAYQRGDYFEKRRRLMSAWAEYLSKPKAAGEVVPLRG